MNGGDKKALLQSVAAFAVLQESKFMDYPLAIQTWSIFIKHKPDDASGYLLRARTQLKIAGSQVQAEKDFLHALKLDPKLRESERDLMKLFQLDEK